MAPAATSYADEGLFRAQPCPSPQLGRFHPAYASTIAGWVRTQQELFFLAPSADPPLTSEKVVAWTRTAGRPLVCQSAENSLIGYAELNPMRNSPSHLWIGHLILDPARRGLGLGEAFTRLLLDHAFHALRARLVSLIVFPQNRAAIRCYGRAGFQVEGEQFHSFGKSERRHRMMHLVVGAPSRDQLTHEHAIPQPAQDDPRLHRV